MQNIGQRSYSKPYWGSSSENDDWLKGEAMGSKQPRSKTRSNWNIPARKKILIK